MSRSRLTNYLRTERLRLGFNQRECAELLGYSSDTISKVEANLRKPTLRLVLAAEIVFGHRTKDLFPKLDSCARRKVLLRAIALEQRLSQKKSSRTERMRAVLSALIDRLQINSPIL